MPRAQADRLPDDEGQVHGAEDTGHDGEVPGHDGHGTASRGPGLEEQAHGQEGDTEPRGLFDGAGQAEGDGADPAGQAGTPAGAEAVPAPHGQNQKGEEGGVGAAGAEHVGIDRDGHQEGSDPPQRAREEHEDQRPGDQPGQEVRPVGDLVVEAEEQCRHLHEEGAGRVGHGGDVTAGRRVRPVVHRSLQEVRGRGQGTGVRVRPVDEEVGRHLVEGPRIGGVVLAHVDPDPLVTEGGGQGGHQCGHLEDRSPRIPHQPRRRPPDDAAEHDQRGQVAGGWPGRPPSPDVQAAEHDPEPHQSSRRSAPAWRSCRRPRPARPVGLPARVGPDRALRPSATGLPCPVLAGS